jgi:hypothetical protein
MIFFHLKRELSADYTDSADFSTVGRRSRRVEKESGVRIQEPGGAYRWGEAPERPRASTKISPETLSKSMYKADKRAEAWPTIDHGSARIVA